MDPRLSEAIWSNDIFKFRTLLQVDEGVLRTRSGILSDTPLHLATLYGHTELVKEILRLCPDMAAEVNQKLDTALHIASAQGNATIFQLLMEANPLISVKLNHENQSVFSLACREGHNEIVRLLLTHPQYMSLEEDEAGSAPLHQAILRGHNDVVEYILESHSKFARKVNKTGNSSLHYACSVGNVGITLLLLRKVPDLGVQINGDGFTPLHLAVINRHLSVVEAFVSTYPNACRCLTKCGETVLHLAVRFNDYEMFVLLAQGAGISDLLHQQNHYGDTILHLAVSTGNCQLVESILNTAVDKECWNFKGQTALDILEQAKNNRVNQKLKNMLTFALNKRVDKHNEAVEEMPDNTHTRPTEFKLSNRQTEDLPIPSVSRQETTFKPKEKGDPSSSEVHLLMQKMDLCTNQDKQQHYKSSDYPAQNMIETSPRFHQSHSKSEVLDESQSESDSLKVVRTSLINMDINRKLGKKLHRLDKSCRKKQYENHREGLQNARNTITLVAGLIATVSFSAGVNPPGSVYQDGYLKGKSTVSRTTAFKIFTISNNVALFTSLSIVIVLVSIVPFQRKQLTKLLSITHKVMWVAVAFMATAFVAAEWVIIPNAKENKWQLELLLAISCGMLGTLFLYLGVLLARHWVRKSAWKERKYRKRGAAGFRKARIQPERKFNNKGEIQSESTNSDVDSCTSVGYHLY
ncbi:hypothetical protein K2173_024315 [Erythroxylum novogranatense]|uniref:PGG domain-containing protein n=1 Tax=Erythroxylum novogranatense TaxID=1862640 RepID=A0AAV8SU05_9ROSI|nr:hypothetical protein K2173_024315 [Erythroxylum novogranatense]